ncbi:AMP-binding protein [Intrasporangium mesophilum]
MTLAPTTPAPPDTPLRPRLPWFDVLDRDPERRALALPGGREITRGELRDLVDAAAAELAGARRLVMVEGANRPEAVVAYLAALRQGHAVLLVDGGNRQAGIALRSAYDPDIEVAADGRVFVHRSEPAVDLHPDLALLLSTSGSTGSPKLVRLSWANLAANAEQVADLLEIRESDCAATSLPMHYCYGLSVLHSHLARGASLALTDLSVVDECFWDLVSDVGATSFAGVPWTFEMLDRAGFADRDLPSLRCVTQAGGRLDPDRIVRWAELGQARGWDFHVMYGQTEATARMAHLPPDLAATRPTAIGRPVAGAELVVEDGELVFTGPNVMLGYATKPADLALGRTVNRLRTGDLGRLAEDGLFEVTGRTSRYAKVLGHRVDLDRVEASLRARGRDVRVAGREGLIAVSARADSGPRVAGQAVRGRGLDAGALRRATATAANAPLGAVTVVQVDDHPVLPTGKVDHSAIVALAESTAAVTVASRAEPSSVATMYAATLHRASVRPGSTFASLGGDSLSYVEVSLRLEALIGCLPRSWHVTPVAELQALADAERARRDHAATARSSGTVETAYTSEAAAPVDGVTETRLRRWTRPRTVETSVWLRAVAILLIVGTHADLFSLQGTAHALLVLVGFNVVRFAFAAPGRRGRIRALGRGTLRIVLPTLAVIVPAHVVWGYYETRNLFLANWVFGEARLGPPWRFWFIEALVFALLVAMLLTALPAFARLERRWPFGVPVALLLAAFTFRLDLFQLPVPRMQGSAVVVLFLFFLGWAIARVETRRQRWLVTVAAVGMVGTFSGNPARDALSLATVLALIWLPTTRMPSGLVPVTQVLAASSLFVYVIHWQVLEQLWGRPIAAFAGSLAAGVAYWFFWTKVATPLVAAIRSRLAGMRAAAVGPAT